LKIFSDDIEEVELYDDEVDNDDLGHLKFWMLMAVIMKWLRWLRCRTPKPKRSRRQKSLRRRWRRRERTKGLQSLAEDPALLYRRNWVNRVNQVIRVIRVCFTI
jgi:hypothetical protein